MKKLILIALLQVSLINCGGGGGGSSSDESDDSSGTGTETGGGSSDPLAAARLACVDRINAFRATESLPPLARWVDKEQCSDEQSDLDSGPTGGPHQHFGMCSEFAWCQVKIPFSTYR